MARASRKTRQSFKKAVRDIEEFAQQSKMETKKAVREIAEENMTEIKAASKRGEKRGVPRNLGTLANTGYVNGPDARNLVVIGFGGAAAPYALVQHERTDYHHEVGEARYLVRQLERWEPGGSEAMSNLARNMDAAARRAGAS